jgi:hypothetical protein
LFLLWGSLVGCIFWYRGRNTRIVDGSDFWDRCRNILAVDGSGKNKCESGCNCKELKVVLRSRDVDDIMAG